MTKPEDRRPAGARGTPKSTVTHTGNGQHPAAGPRFGLLPRIGLALGVVGLLPLALAVVLLTTINREALEDQVLRSHTLAARATAARVEAFVGERTALAAAVAANAAASGLRSEATAEVLSTSLQGYADRGVLVIALVTARGEELLRAQLKSAEARAAAAVADGHPADVRPVLLESADGPVLLVDVPAGEGVLARIVADARELDELLQPTELGEEADLVLVSSEGLRLAGSRTPLAEWPAELVEAALSGEVMGAKRRMTTPGGGTFLGAFAPVGTSGWAVLSRQPTAVAEAAALRMRRGAAWATAAALLLIALLAGLSWAQFVQPLRRLLAAQRSLAGLFGRQPQGGDEIRQLEWSFAALEQSLRDRDRTAQVFLGRYQVLGVLGVGGMGTVFRGWDPKLERPVALKTVRLGSDFGEAERKQLAARLLREAINAARFQHPNIVAVHDAAHAPGGAFVAMELVEGQSLERFLWERGRLPPELVIPLGAAVARALAAAHGHEIVHRDIKPGNVLLGRDGAIKVVDFGISATIAEALRADGTQVLGTPGYIAPELLQGDPGGPAADLFALGVLLYTSLAGELPILGRGGAPPRRIPSEPALPPDAEAFLLDLLADPSRRPRSAQAVAERLEEIARRERWQWQAPTGSGGHAPSPATNQAATQWLSDGQE